MILLSFQLLIAVLLLSYTARHIYGTLELLDVMGNDLSEIGGIILRLIFVSVVGTAGIFLLITGLSKLW